MIRATRLVLLAGLLARGAAAAGETPGAARLAVDLAPGEAAPWLAPALEELFARQLERSSRLAPAERVAARACAEGDEPCRLGRYRAAGVAVVIFGRVGR